MSIDIADLLHVVGMGPRKTLNVVALLSKNGIKITDRRSMLDHPKAARWKREYEKYLTTPQDHGVA